MTRGLPVLLASIALTVAWPRQAAAQAAYEEVPLLLRHRPEVATMITALFDGSEFHLPLVDVLRHLRISHSLDATTGRLRLQFGLPRRAYQLDLVNSLALVGDSTVALPDEAFVRRDLEVFVRPGLLEQLFDWRTRIDRARLAVELVTREEMPVTREARERRRAVHRSSSTESWESAVHFARNRRLLDGAMLGYLFSASDGGRALGELRAGLAVLGGALDAAGDGRRTDQGGVFQLRRLQWHYVAGFRALTQIHVGDLYNASFPGRSLKGVALSNRPIEVRRVVGTQLIEGTAPPGWQVELLLNGIVQDEVSTDALGRFRFEIPLGHGTSRVRVRMLGPDGEVREEERQFEVPFAFLPRGRVDYSFAAGRADDGESATQVDVAIGLSNRVSLQTLLDFPGSGKSATSLRTAVSLRLLRGYVARLEASPRSRYRADLEAALPAFARLSASYTRHDRSHVGAPRNEYAVRTFLPVRAGGTQGSVRLNFVFRQENDARSHLLSEAEVATSYRRVRPAIGYRLSRRNGPGDDRSQELRVGAFFDPRWGRRWLRGTALRGTAVYDPESGGVTAREFTAHRGFTSGRAIELTARQSSAAQGTEIQIRLRLDRGWTRASLAASSSATGSDVTQTASGTLGWDWRSGRAQFTGRSSNPRAAATLNLFLDANGNGVQDAGEEPVAGYEARTDRMVELRRAGDGTVSISDLAAHHRYRVRLLASREANSLLMPYFETFSFIADPNSYKPIAVPFYASGVIEGSVLRQIGTEQRPVLGLRLLVQGSDSTAVSVPVFGDGTFYHFGLRPGRYEVRIDPQQLAALGLAATPEVRSIALRPGREGDVVRSLNFVLTPAEEHVRQGR